jgi:CDP-glycerol glycerophosphotransferase
MSDRAAVPVSGGKPSLSIVVPIYNVEAYLDECLESITRQTVQDFEVLMVDDGSTDQSGAIAERWAARDSRFSLVRQDNHGLGHARNSGVSHATGKYLAFLDSDDRVDEDAYRRMIETLDATGSDFATGNVHRFDSSGRTWQAPLYRGMAKTEELKTHISRNHELLRDHLAPNKVWRSSFWRAAGLKFPDGLYEDVPTIIPAHVMARSVDVVPVIAALWRVRDQGDSSITQNRSQNVRHLRDRISAVAQVSRFIGEHADQDLKDAYDALVLRRDLRWYVDLFPDVDPDYQDELISSVRAFLEQVSPEAMRRTPVAMRIAYGLLAEGARKGFESYVALRRAGKVDELPVSVDGGRALVDVPVDGATDLPSAVCDITDQLNVVSRTSDFRVADGLLLIDGWAYVRRLRVDEDQKISVRLMNNGSSIPASVKYRHDQRAVADVGAQAEATGRVAFTASVPLRKLYPNLHARLRRRAVSWTVMVAVSQNGLSYSARLAKPLAGPPERPLMVQVRSGQWLRVSWAKEGLICRIRTEGALLEAVKADGQVVELTLRTGEPAGSGSVLRLRRGTESHDVRVTRDASDKRLARASIVTAELPGWDDPTTRDSDVAWNLLYRRSAARSWQRVLDPVGRFGEFVSAGGAYVSVRRSRAATVDLVRCPARPTVLAVEWTRGATISVTMANPHGVEIDAVVLKAAKQDETVPLQVSTTDGKLIATRALDAIDCFGETVPLRAGTWDMFVRTAAGVEVPVSIGGALLDELPAEVESAGRSYRFTDRQINILSLIVETDLGWNDRGNANQRWLRTEFYPSAKTGLQDVVLYESYFGKQFSDSPRDIFDELRRRRVDLEHVIVVRDQQFKAPPGATAIAHRSTAYYEALAQARYIVTNTHLPSTFRRAQGQVILQTWHGVGTKKIGLDMAAIHFANKGYVDNLRNGEADNWDYLISPNPFTSPILRRAFAFHRTLLETGAPRNDIFHRDDRSERAVQIRQRLGIDPAKKIVLYAPTWRDNNFDGPGRYRLDLRFDLYEAARKLGDDYVIIFRKHSNVVDRLPPGHGAVIDASDYPEVQELLLVTDVLISDYSTLMCDFANTGRPMLFYTYDLANYRDVLRGFYFDFENDVPGPLITNEADLLPAVLDAEAIRSEYDAKYRAFADRFCQWDDGHAAERVVDAVFGGVL